MIIYCIVLNRFSALTSRSGLFSLQTRVAPKLMDTPKINSPSTFDCFGCVWGIKHNGLDKHGGMLAMAEGSIIKPSVTTSTLAKAPAQKGRKKAEKEAPAPPLEACIYGGNIHTIIYFIPTQTSMLLLRMPCYCSVG